MTEEAERGTIKDYPYSVKIEQTALGARVSVHCYSNSRIEAVNNCMWLYEQARTNLEQSGFKVAPEEPTPKKERNSK